MERQANSFLPRQSLPKECHISLSRKSCCFMLPVCQYTFPNWVRDRKLQSMNKKPTSAENHAYIGLAKLYFFLFKTRAVIICQCLQSEAFFERVYVQKKMFIRLPKKSYRESDFKKMFLPPHPRVYSFIRLISSFISRSGIFSRLSTKINSERLFYPWQLSFYNIFISAALWLLLRDH